MVFKPSDKGNRTEIPVIEEPLNPSQKVALRYYKAYGALCGHAGDGIDKKAGVLLRAHRELLHRLYKVYDPDNSFDVSRKE